jgi:peptidoglycan/xylan/chitin deacetylase (PgdA/CDA1 family)
MRPLLQWASPAGPRGRLSTLIFHRVLPAPDPLFPGELDAAAFDRVCGWLREWFNVIPLDEASGRLRDGTLPARALAITFDDGYADNHDVALPILRRHGLPATFFIATGYLDGRRMWNDTVIEAVRRSPHSELDLSGVNALKLPRLPVATPAQKSAAIEAVIGRAKYLEPEQRQAAVEAVAASAGAELPADLMMTSDQVRALRRAGMLIGAHTQTHPILARLAPAQARVEISEGKRDLENLLGEPVRLFAYPNGKPGQDYTPEHPAMVRDAGFDAAVSTAWGAAHSGSAAFELPRFTPWDRTRLRFGLRMLANLRAAAH